MGAPITLRKFFSGHKKFSCLLVGHQKSSISLVVTERKSSSLMTTTDEFAPRYKELPFVQYFDHALKRYTEVKTDQELVMFDKHAEIKIVRMFVAYYDPSDSNPEPR